MRKFYSPYGSLKLFPGRQAVSLHFFIVDRTGPAAPYQQTVLGYDHLSPEQKEAAEVAVRELFTEEEYHAFRDFMERVHGEDVRTGMLMAPVNVLKPANELGLGLARPFSRHPAGASGGIFRLSEEVEWALPFRVWGFFTDPQSR